MASADLAALAFELSQQRLDKQERVLLPRDRLIFALVGSAVYEQFYGLEGGQEEVHQRLAYGGLGRGYNFLTCLTRVLLQAAPGPRLRRPRPGSAALKRAPVRRRAWLGFEAGHGL